MSVITRRLGAKDLTVYCKGSPEMIQSLSRPETGVYKIILYLSTNIERISRSKVRYYFVLTHFYNFIPTFVYIKTGHHDQSEPNFGLELP